MAMKNAEMTVGKIELQKALRKIQNKDYESAYEDLLLLEKKYFHDYPIKKIISFNRNFCLGKLGRLSKGEKQIWNTHKNKISVGVIAPHDPSKGLYRDAETVLWACDSVSKFDCSIFQPDIRLRLLANNPVSNQQGIVIRGTETENSENWQLNDWLNTIDVLWIFEVLTPILCVFIKSIRKIKTILYVPNLEWAIIDSNGEDHFSWEKFLKKNSDFVVPVSRTNSISEILTTRGISSINCPWSIPDPVIKKQKKSTSNKLKVLMNVGNVGFKDRRGLDIFIESLELLNRDDHEGLSVKVKVNKEIPKNVYQKIVKMNITLITDFFQNRESILDLYDWADVVVYPSRFEGFGLSLLEALHRGCYVLATNGTPMNELVPKEMFKISAEFAGHIRLANSYEPHTQHLAECLAILIKDNDILNKDWSPLFIDRQSTFKSIFRSICELFGGDDFT